MPELSLMQNIIRLWAYNVNRGSFGILRKISPHCDELVAVGWRNLAAKGALGSGRLVEFS